MFKYSKRSSDRLTTCHPLLQELFKEVIKHVDCTIIEGSRRLDKQKEYFDTGRSKTMDSKHLIQEDGYSHAVDVLPCKIKWDFSPKNYMFVGFVRGIAASLGIQIRVGADWDGDFNTTDQTFHDIPHFELLSTTRLTGNKDTHSSNQYATTVLEVHRDEIQKVIKKLKEG